MKRFILCAVAAATLAACGGGQTDTCKKYLACSEAVSAGSTASLDSTYGPKGSCWSTNTATADACDSACETAIASLKTGNPDQAECK